MRGINKRFPTQNVYGTGQPPNQCPPGLGGYSIVSDTQIGLYELGKVVQLFGSRPSATLGVGPSQYISDNTKRVSMTQQEVDTTSERLWIVSVNAIEVNQIGDNEVFVQRMFKDRILSSADTPPGANRYSTMQAEIIWMDGSAKSAVKLIDIAGGTNLQVFGRNVQVNLLVPADTEIVENGDAPPGGVGLTGIVFNGLYSAKIAPTIVGAPCLDILKFTKWTQVEPDAVNMVEIPPGARKVRVYNSRLSEAATTELDFWLSNSLINGYSVGILDFVNPNSTDLFEIPCGATHIATNPPVDAMRYLTFVFMIDP